MSEAMLKKYDGNGSGEKSRLDPLVRIFWTMKRLQSEPCRRLDLGRTEEDNTLDFSNRVTQEEPLGNYKQYGMLTDQS